MDSYVRDVDEIGNNTKIAKDNRGGRSMLKPSGNQRVIGKKEGEGRTDDLCREVFTYGAEEDNT